MLNNYLMSKVIVVYGSTGGNTQGVAERITDILRAANHEVELKNVTDANTQEILDYDVILFGSSTWNDGDLQDDFIPYHMELEENPPSLAGKKAASFGTGESIYEYFCKAVIILDESLAKYGAEVVVKGLEIDGYPEEEDNVAKIEEWTKELLAKI